MGPACQRTLLPAVVALVLSGCTAGEVELYEPEGSGLGQGLTVKVELEAAAAELGEALGWSDGVPEAEVRVHRFGIQPFQWQTALTDTSGLAQFPDLLPGFYRVAAYRVLSDEEVEQLGGQRRAFGDGRIIELRGPKTLTLTLLPDQRGSLLISEVYGTSPKVYEVQWEYHHYLEVYNNSDTTIYMDGKIVGLAWQVFTETESKTCDQTAVWRADPNGVWTRYFHQFPGSGTDYPLAPGQIAVVAKDAIDHSQIHPTFPDLTRADFELFGYGDVDNPAVPNMPEIGLAPYYGGHGINLWIGRPFFLSERVDVETLPRMWIEGANVSYEYARIPREALLDVLATATNDAAPGDPCLEGKVHRDFDRLDGGFIHHGDDLEYSVQRVVLDTTPDGRVILQDTNTSAVDLIRALYTVGTLPPQN